MNFKLIEVKNNENILLNGCLVNNNSKRLILFIPGMGDSFFENRFAKTIMKDCKKYDYDFLFAHNQGSFSIMNLRQIDGNHHSRSVVRGSAFERFDDCLSDLEVWFSYAEERYDEIIVLTHSLGCNKTTYYLANHPKAKVRKIIYLAPQDSSMMDKLPIHEGMLEEAILNVENKQADKLLSKKFLGCFIMSSGTMTDLSKNKNINNIPYLKEGSDYTMLNQIDVPMLFVMGDKDAGVHSKIFMKRVASHVKEGEYAIIEKANHNFRNKEQELSTILFNYLKK